MLCLIVDIYLKTKKDCMRSTCVTTYVIPRNPQGHIPPMDIQVDSLEQAACTLAHYSHDEVANVDTNIVDFNGLDDPKDPLNWPNRYKWSMVILISILSLIV